MNAIQAPAIPAGLAGNRTTPPLPPPYSLEPVLFTFPALAASAASAALGGNREMALAAITAARLMLASVPPVALGVPERTVRAERAKNWLSALSMPQPARMAVIRALDASIESGMEGAASIREMMHVLTGHISPAALVELGALAERLRLYYEQTP